MKKSYYLLSFLLVFSSAFAQNLQLNEVVTQNSFGLEDLDSDRPDWIEIYNPTDKEINLAGYSLSDESTNRQKWTFKNGSIKPDSFLVVFASDKSHDSLVGTRESVEDISSIGWDYADSNDETSPGTSKVSYTLFPNSVFGTLDNKKAVAANIYLGPAGNLGYSYAGVHVKFKDWGAEINRSGYDLLRIRLYLEKDKNANIRFSQTGLEDWLNYTVPLTGNGDTSWIDIPLNGNIGRLDLSKLTGISIVAPDNAYGQSFDFVITNIQFSVQAKERFHTNFKLSAGGETLFLSAPNFTTIDAINIPSLASDLSFGRKSESSLEWTVFEKPTPEKPNNGISFNGVCDKTLIFDKTSGFYSGNQEINITGATEIRYTLDGSKPTKSALLYTSPIVTDTTVVISVACFDNNSVPKTIFANTYFLNYDTKLPVWSISTNPENFFDIDSGIYVLGREGTYEEGTPYFGANFWEDWEKPVHIEFFEEDKSLAFELDCGIKIFGNYSRANAKKSLSLYFRGAYGTSKLEYPIFKDYPGVESFDDLLLRSSGGDESLLHFRDGFNHTLAKDLNFETMKYRPSVLFINGRYWGIHNIREKSNEDYFQENYNIPKEDIDIITSYFNDQEGPTTQEFIDFHDRVKSGDADFSEIENTIDIESFIDYHIFEIYIGNYDWPSNNSKYWRQSSTDGKWRWFLYDTDFTTSIYLAFGDSNTSYVFDNFKNAMTFEPDVFWPNSEGSTLLLRECMKNKGFKERFVNRYCDLMNTLFVPDSVFSTLQKEVLDKIEEEVPVNRQRWGLDPENWYVLLDEYKEYWQNRAPYARLHMKNQIALDEEVNLNLAISPAGAGYIKLNTIEIDDPLWSGIYFKGIPVNIEAIPNPGFTFNNWSSSTLGLNDPNNSKIINIDLTEDNSFTANFSGAYIEPKIVISEINYHSPSDFDTQDWIELYNDGEATVDLSDWILKDLKRYNRFEIPIGTIINPGEYLIFAEDTSVFHSVHKNIKPIGPLEFSLSNSGETVQLWNNRGKLIQQVSYLDKNPWPVYADGIGGTLELIKTDSDISDPYNWTSVCFAGSPMQGYDPYCPQGFSGFGKEYSTMELSISPNPSSEKILLEAGEIGIESVSIIGLEGNIWLESKSNEINISQLPTGIYLVKTHLENGAYAVSRFVRE